MGRQVGCQNWCFVRSCIDGPNIVCFWSGRTHPLSAAIYSNDDNWWACGPPHSDSAISVGTIDLGVSDGDNGMGVVVGQFMPGCWWTLPSVAFATLVHLVSILAGELWMDIASKAAGVDGCCGSAVVGVVGAGTASCGGTCAICCAALGGGGNIVAICWRQNSCCCANLCNCCMIWGGNSASGGTECSSRNPCIASRITGSSGFKIGRMIPADSICGGGSLALYNGFGKCSSEGRDGAAMSGLHPVCGNSGNGATWLVLCGTVLSMPGGDNAGGGTLIFNWDCIWAGVCVDTWAMGMVGGQFQSPGGGCKPSWKVMWLTPVPDGMVCCWAGPWALADAPGTWTGTRAGMWTDCITLATSGTWYANSSGMVLEGLASTSMAVFVSQGTERVWCCTM